MEHYFGLPHERNNSPCLRMSWSSERYNVYTMECNAIVEEMKDPKPHHTQEEPFYIAIKP
jgi:hypothetical protein